MLKKNKDAKKKRALQNLTQGRGELNPRKIRTLPTPKTQRNTGRVRELDLVVFTDYLMTRLNTDWKSNITEFDIGKEERAVVSKAIHLVPTNKATDVMT